MLNQIIKHWDRFSAVFRTASLNKTDDWEMPASTMRPFLKFCRREHDYGPSPENADAHEWHLAQIRRRWERRRIARGTAAAIPGQVKSRRL